MLPLTVFLFPRIAELLACNIKCHFIAELLFDWFVFRSFANTKIFNRVTSLDESKSVKLEVSCTVIFFPLTQYVRSAGIEPTATILTLQQCDQIWRFIGLWATF